MNFSGDAIHTIENLTNKNKTNSISIYVVLVLALIAMVVSLPFIKIDITNQSRGIIRPVAENVFITSLVSGMVTKSYILNNQTVKKGDTLFTIATTNLDAKQQLNDSLLAINASELKDFDFLISNTPDSIKSPVLLKSWLNYQTNQQELQSRLQQARIAYKRNKKLYEKKVIAKVELEKQTFNLQFAQQALSKLNAHQKSTWQAERFQREDQLRRLQSTIDQLAFQERMYTVKAPISGTIENLNGLQTGSFVNTNQVIGTLSPNDFLIVENTVLPNDIGLLQIGQQVKFQIDAFNYNEWGMLEGEIIDIDKNITLQEQTAFFKVRCSLYATQLQLKNGYNATVKKGMTLTTRYFITRRSLYDLLFDKADDWLNPKLLN